MPFHLVRLSRARLGGWRGQMRVVTGMVGPRKWNSRDVGTVGPGNARSHSRYGGYRWVQSVADSSARLPERTVGVVGTVGRSVKWVQSAADSLYGWQSRHVGVVARLQGRHGRCRWHGCRVGTVGVVGTVWQGRYSGYSRYGLRRHGWQVRYSGYSPVADSSHGWQVGTVGTVGSGLVGTVGRVARWVQSAADSSAKPVTLQLVEVGHGGCRRCGNRWYAR